MIIYKSNRDHKRGNITYRYIGPVYCQVEYGVAEGNCDLCHVKKMTATPSAAPDLKNWAWNEVKRWAREHRKMHEKRGDL